MAFPGSELHSDGEYQNVVESRTKKKKKRPSSFQVYADLRESEFRSCRVRGFEGHLGVWVFGLGENPKRQSSAMLPPFGLIGHAFETSSRGVSGESIESERGSYWGILAFGGQPRGCPWCRRRPGPRIEYPESRPDYPKNSHPGRPTR